MLDCGIVRKFLSDICLGKRNAKKKIWYIDYQFNN